MYEMYADGKILYNPMISDRYPVISPKCTKEVNKAGSLNFTLPPSHPLYGELHKLKTYVEVRRDGNIIWKGRILNDENDFYNRKSTYAEGCLSFLIDGTQRPYKFSGTVEELFDFYLGSYNQQVESWQRIKKGTTDIVFRDTLITKESKVYPDTFTEIMDQLVNSGIDGYLVPSYEDDNFAFTLNYLEEPGKVSSQVIRFGENLLDFSEYIDASNVFTILIPLGARSETEDGSEGDFLTIAGVNDGKDYLENKEAIDLFGRIVRSHNWDEETDPISLKSKAEELLYNNVNMSVTLTISAVDLRLAGVNTDALECGDRVRVVSPPHGVDAYFLCSKIVLDLQNPDNTQYTFGVGFSAMTDKQVSQQKTVNQAYTIVGGAMNTVSNTNIKINSDYVNKLQFDNFQQQVNTNFNVLNGNITEIESKISVVYRYKGSVDDYESLPTINLSIGDVYNLLDTGANYAWSEDGWDKLSETIDFSAYVTREEYASLEENVKTLEEMIKSLEGGNG